MGRILVVAKVVLIEMARRKDLYVLLILLGVLLFSLLSVNVFGLGTTVRYVLDLGLLMAWLFSLILIVGVSCRQLPGEERRGTIYPLLAKPLTRGELIAGKWLGSWCSVVLATAVFYILVALVVELRGGTFGWASLGQAWFLQAVGLAAVAALGIALSTRLTYGAAVTYTYVAMGASLLVVPQVPRFLVSETGFRANALLVLYYAFPHFDLFDMRLRVVHERGMLSWSTFGILVAYGGVLTAIFLVVGWMAYRKKRFQRGEVL